LRVSFRTFTEQLTPEGRKSMRSAQIRFRIEVALAVVAAALAFLTLVTQEWVEVLFGIDPDKGSGGFEWAIVIALLVAAAALAAIARWDRKRHIVAAA
jgi:hypothetical protein